MNAFDELASAAWGCLDPNCFACKNNARIIEAVMEATREHLMAEPGTVPCDDPPDGDGTILGDKCRADIARRAAEKLK